MYLATLFHYCYFQHIQSWSSHQCERQAASDLLGVASLYAKKHKYIVHICSMCALHFIIQFVFLVCHTYVIKWQGLSRLRAVATYSWQLVEEICCTPSSVNYVCHTWKLVANGVSILLSFICSSVAVFDSRNCLWYHQIS